MPAFHNFFPFFSGRFAAPEEEDKEQCLFGTVLFWPSMTLSQFGLEVFEFCIQVSDILISNLNHLKIRLKSK
jgi:hypothetical protein